MSVVANVAINVDSRNAVSQLAQVETRAKATQQAFGALQQAAAAFGVGFALSKVIADVKELDTNLRRLGTVGGDVTALEKGLGQLSKNLGGVANKAELAAASYQALSAGFTDTAGNIKIVEAATKAAVGGLADTTQVTSVLTKTLNAYNLSGSQAIQVTDSISKAIEFGQVEWSDYTSQLGRVASIAAIAGVSLDEVNAFIAASTKNGATAEIAFTGLGATLNTLLQPTKESQEAASALGIQWNLAGLQSKGFSGLIAELAQKIGTNQEAAVRLLGSQEALRGAFAAAAKGGNDYQAALESISSATGKTDKDFQALKTSLENQLKALDTAFKNLSEALGKAFGSTVVDAIGDVTGVINGFADAINAIPRPVAAAVAEIVRVIAQMILLQKAIQGVIALRAAFVATLTSFAATTAATGVAATTSSSAFALYTGNAKALQAASLAATGSVGGLAAALSSLAAIGIITVGVNYVITQTGAIIGSSTAAGKSEAAGTKASLAQQLQGKSAAERKKLLATAQKNLANDQRLASNLALQIQAQDNAALSAGERALPSDRSKLTEVQARIRTNQARIKAIQTTPITSARPNSPTLPAGVGGGVGGDGGGDKKKEKKARESELPALQTELDLKNRILEITSAIGQARLDGNKATEAALQIDQILAERSAKIADINREKIPQAEKERKIKIATVTADQQLVEASFARQKAAQDLAREQQKAIEDVISGLDIEKIKIQAKTEAEKQAIQFLEIENQLKAQGVALTDADKEKIRLKIAEIQKLIKEQEAANAKLQIEKELFEGIAGTVAGAVSGAIDVAVKGTESFGDALKNLAGDLAATIGKLLIVFGIAQALGALGGNDGKGVFSFLAAAFGFKAAKDGAYWPGGFEAFANGGVVTKPTMGLIGEGGEPEYVIPARKMNAAMARYSKGVRGDAVVAGEGGSAQAAAVSAGPMEPIDVRYSVERINSIEYVTNDQFQRGLAQAAQQGAAQGERRALRTLSNSPANRRRIGL